MPPTTSVSSMSQFVTIVRRRIAENQPGQTDPLDPATGPFFRDPPEIAELERFDQLYYEPNEPQNYVFTNYRTAITYSKQLANRLGFELRIKTTGVNMREGTVCKYVCCQRQGLAEHGWKPKEGVRQRQRDSVRCDCQWNCKLIGIRPISSDMASDDTDGMQHAPRDTDEDLVWVWKRADEDKDFEHNHVLDLSFRILSGSNRIHGLQKKFSGGPAIIGPSRMGMASASTDRQSSSGTASAHGTPNRSRQVSIVPGALTAITVPGIEQPLFHLSPEQQNMLAQFASSQGGTGFVPLVKPLQSSSQQQQQHFQQQAAGALMSLGRPNNGEALMSGSSSVPHSPVQPTVTRPVQSLEHASLMSPTTMPGTMSKDGTGQSRPGESSFLNLSANIPVSLESSSASTMSAPTPLATSIRMVEMMPPLLAITGPTLTSATVGGTLSQKPPSAHTLPISMTRPPIRIADIRVSIGKLLDSSSASPVQQRQQTVKLPVTEPAIRSTMRLAGGRQVLEWKYARPEKPRRSSTATAAAAPAATQFTGADSTHTSTDTLNSTASADVAVEMSVASTATAGGMSTPVRGGGDE